MIKGRVLIVEDEDLIRDAMGPLLEGDGYEVFFAENGRDALTKLYTESLPDIILLDLRMPVMNGWEFRTIQKGDPKLARIPVVAVSADGSEQAAAISAHAYLRKPIDGAKLLITIQSVLTEKERQMSQRTDETERLASLGRLAAGVAHEINNPLAFVILNVAESIARLRSSMDAPGALMGASQADSELKIKTRLADITDMLEDCQIGSERIRETVSNLQRLSRAEDDHRGPIDVRKLIEQSVSMVWNQIRHHARLVKSFGTVPSITGNGAALGQVFLNLLVNAVQAIPEGAADKNEIRISTQVEVNENGPELVVEISDSGKGIAPENASRVFEPFFTTKAVGQGTGLGLSISRQTVQDHGGRLTFKSGPGRGTTFRIVLPIITEPFAVSTPYETSIDPDSLSHGRILVIDDEPLICRIIERTLRAEHKLVIVQSASEALLRLERGEKFDLVLCDVVMPEMGGPEFYAAVAQRWPDLVARLVFMTGGAFTPKTIEFIKRVRCRVLSKPFDVALLKQTASEYIHLNGPPA
jgi:signal transduction histidine kinase